MFVVYKGISSLPENFRLSFSENKISLHFSHDTGTDYVWTFAPGGSRVWLLGEPFRTKLWGIFNSHALLKLLECCVECSVHLVFILLSNSCGMSLDTNLCDMKYCRLDEGGGDRTIAPCYLFCNKLLLLI